MAHTAEATAAQTLGVIARLTTTLPSPPKDSYPPIASIPNTPASRLAEAVADSPIPPQSTTVLYLAYGSNLCAETFLGARGIRPISQVNVSAPTLRLTFDLPGLPYNEPCFANTAVRKVPKIPDPTDPPKLPPFDPPPFGGKYATWDKGLIGVVYEVTKADYAKIIATEGGGASYQDILVPCFVLPPKISVPEKPPIEIPKPFLAHTLFSPDIPDAPPDEPDDPDHPDPRKKWYWRFITRPRRPNPDYAQASVRYLKLITDGAAEHDLPDDYQAYLRSLQPYTVTTLRQKIGWAVLMFFMLPLFLVYAQLGKMLADKNGKLPAWMTITMAVWFNLTWMSYDGIWKKLFGDGERTEEENDSRSTFPRGCRWSRSNQGDDEEKVKLLETLE